MANTIILKFPDKSENPNISSRNNEIPDLIQLVQNPDGSLMYKGEYIYASPIGNSPQLLKIETTDSITDSEDLGKKIAELLDVPKSANAYTLGTKESFREPEELFFPKTSIFFLDASKNYYVRPIQFYFIDNKL